MGGWGRDRESGISLKNLQCNSNKCQKKKNIPNKTCPVLTCPPRHRCYLETVSCVGTLPRANHYQPLSALRQLPGGVTPACARCELSQPVAMLHLVKSPRSFFLPKKKEKKKRFPSTAGARGGGEGGRSTTVCQVENPTVHIFSSLLPMMVLHCR